MQIRCWVVRVTGHSPGWGSGCCCSWAVSLARSTLGNAQRNLGRQVQALSGVHVVRAVQLSRALASSVPSASHFFPSTIYFHYRIIKKKLNWSPLSLFTLCSKYFYHVVLCAGSAVNFSIAAGSFVITLLIMNCCLLAVAACTVMISAGRRVIERKKWKKMCRPWRPQDN